MSAHLWGRGELETEFHHVDKSTGPACIMKPHIKTLDTKAQLLPGWHPRGTLGAYCHTLCQRGAAAQDSVQRELGSVLGCPSRSAVGASLGAVAPSLLCL